MFERGEVTALATFSEACLEAAGAATNQDKIRYLKRYRLLDKEIDERLEEIAHWREKLQKVTAVYSKEPLGGGSIHRREELIARLIDTEREITEDLAYLMTLREDIERRVEDVEDSREQLLLRYRYLRGMTFEEIAVELDLSWRWVHILHSRALHNIQI